MFYLHALAPVRALNSIAKVGQSPYQAIKCWQKFSYLLFFLYLFYPSDMSVRQGFGTPPQSYYSGQYLRYKKYFNHEHFIRKHYFDAERYLDESQPSLFSRRFSVSEIYEMVKSTVEHSDGIKLQGFNKIIFEMKFSVEIGKDADGKEAYVCKVVACYDGFELPDVVKYKDLSIITAYPV